MEPKRCPLLGKGGQCKILRMELYCFSRPPRLGLHVIDGIPTSGRKASLSEAIQAT